MSQKISRRSFFKKSAVMSASALIGSQIPQFLNSSSSVVLGAEKIDIAAIKGGDYFSNTIKAVELLGGIKNFVSKGSKVGLLVNSPWKNPGTYTNPDIVLAVIQMCYDAGASEIYSLENASGSYWNRSTLAKKFSDQIKSLKPAGNNHIKVELPKAKNLKDAHVEKALMECDVFINIPKTKDHAGTRLTGVLKNMMGAAAYDPTNHFIHFGTTRKNWNSGGYNDSEFLSQNIADLGLVRKPNLCIADATEILLTNGPDGPGKMAKPNYIVAGVDPVAMDAYCARFLNLVGSDLPLLKRAFEHGLGEINLTKLKIKEA